MLPPSLHSHQPKRLCDPHVVPRMFVVASFRRVRRTTHVKLPGGEVPFSCRSCSSRWSGQTLARAMTALIPRQRELRRRRTTQRHVRSITHGPRRTETEVPAPVLREVLVPERGTGVPRVVVPGTREPCGRPRKMCSMGPLRGICCSTGDVQSLHLPRRCRAYRTSPMRSLSSDPPDASDFRSSHCTKRSRPVGPLSPK